MDGIIEAGEILSPKILPRKYSTKFSTDENKSLMVDAVGGLAGSFTKIGDFSPLAFCFRWRRINDS